MGRLSTRRFALAFDLIALSIFGNGSGKFVRYKPFLLIELCQVLYILFQTDSNKKVYLRRSRHLETSEANKEAARKLRQSGGTVIPCQSAVTLYKLVK